FSPLVFFPSLSSLSCLHPKIKNLHLLAHPISPYRQTDTASAIKDMQPPCPILGSWLTVLAG
ncbi:MAG: hypothetical protein RLP02_17335, partial [Coleofasciculus sp. C2-GNP5-27]